MSGKSSQTRVRRIPVGVSSCLLGERVRYDGGHKGHFYITHTLSDYFEFRSFCPELAIGLGVPRRPIRLQRQGRGVIRCVQIDDSAKDYTQALESCADEQRGWQQALCGYILKKDSPSCGMDSVKVWGDNLSSRDGVGIFAGRLMENFPHLPVEEEEGLGDPPRRENFVQRVFAMHRWHEMQANGITVAGLMDFHVRHKLILTSHDQEACRRLGCLVANTRPGNLEENASRYLLDFMAALQKRAQEPQDSLSGGTMPAESQRNGANSVWRRSHD